MISQQPFFAGKMSSWPHESHDVVHRGAAISPSLDIPALVAIEPSSHPEEDDTAEILRNRLKGLVHHLELCWSDDRVILTGVCPSYHAKQLVSSMTQQLVTDRHICNQICVER